MKYFLSCDGFISLNGEPGVSGVNVSNLPNNFSSLVYDDELLSGKIEFQNGTVQIDVTNESEIQNHLSISLTDILNMKTTREAEIVAENE